jgi:hypothetical protein
MGRSLSTGSLRYLLPAPGFFAKDGKDFFILDLVEAQIKLADG